MQNIMEEMSPIIMPLYGTLSASYNCNHIIMHDAEYQRILQSFKDQLRVSRMFNKALHNNFS